MPEPDDIPDWPTPFSEITTEKRLMIDLQSCGGRVRQLGVRERRKALKAWFDDLEQRIKEMLADLKITDNIEELRDGVQAHRIGDLDDTPISHEAKSLVVGLFNKKSNEEPGQESHRMLDLLHALEYLRRCRLLLARRQPEAIPLQMLWLGQRMSMAGYAVIEGKARRADSGRREGGKKSAQVRARSSTTHRQVVAQKVNETIAKGKNKNAAFRYAAAEVKRLIENGELEQLTYRNGRPKVITSRTVRTWFENK